MVINLLYQKFLVNRTVCTDTRKIVKGCIYFALKGENFDGNDFAVAALKTGADWAVVDKVELAENERFVFVENVLETLQKLALHHRQQLNIPVIAITGSNGKTTTKELLFSVLSQHYKTQATIGNLNNHIGVPLSILSISDETDMAIIEMGANHQNEIAFLCSIVMPTHGLITNVGKAHLEGFGGFEGVKIGKGELYDHIEKTGGTIFNNGDNYHLVDMIKERKVKSVISFGFSADNFVSGSIVNSSPFLKVAWHRQVMEIDDHMHTAKSNLTGNYNFENIMASICIGTYFKLSPNQVIKGIEVYQPANSRSQLKKTVNNTLICDYYNANPSSMIAAIENLQSSKNDSVAFILGDMFELGPDAEIEHVAIIKKALQLNAGRSIFIGIEFYKHKDMFENKAEFFQTTEKASQILKSNPLSGFMILVKGSRGMKLENLVDLL